MRSMRGNTNAYIAVVILAVVASIIGISLVVWNQTRQYDECVVENTRTLTIDNRMPIAQAGYSAQSVCNEDTATRLGQD